VAWSLRHGEHDALLEAISEPADAREGQRDFCVVYFCTPNFSSRVWNQLERLAIT
jgi:hypothetical protein